MSVVTLHLAQAGGSATRAELLDVVTTGTFEAAVRSGEVVRHRRGVYGLPLDPAEDRVAQIGALLSHRSAALHHGLNVLHAPELPEAVISRSRSLPVPHDVDLRFRSLTPESVDGQATTALQTVVDCARDLPLPESLSVADSALRSGALTRADLDRALESLPRTGRARATRVLQLASAEAANPFESGLRALATETTDQTWVPQAPVTLRNGRVLHADAGHLASRVTLEADSQQSHKSRADIMRDCNRYNEMILAGWVVLRFAWEHVMFHPDWVREVIAWVVGQRRGVSRGSSMSA
ncbi:hypothetical protein [Janibacter cremeus]|uniref:DUF559 domain-containing protein n=1 Tax=Janibacter cremeus TaxID=1285192 RepID=A0A852VPU1_9MICO|nr:hypothetical protein [Janibacter cremeus]NYF98982.1 hypothetical protein [Janibacter cremeus]